MRSAGNNFGYFSESFIFIWTKNWDWGLASIPPMSTPPCIALQAPWAVYTPPPTTTVSYCKTVEEDIYIILPTVLSVLNARRVKRKYR